MSDRIFHEFRIGEVFSIQSTSSGIDKNRLTCVQGNIPYITRTDRNNGIDHFIGEQNLKYFIDKRNVITIGLDTQTIFYQPHKFYTGQNIQILDFSHLNASIAKYIIPLLKAQMIKFNWGGNGATLTRLRKTKILLPVRHNGNPDFEYMGTHIKELKDKKEKEYLDYIFERYKEFKSITRPVALGEKEWRTFKLIDVFTNIQRGRRLKKSDHKEGNTAYVSSTAMNNGVDGFVSNINNVRIFKNCLALANSGSVGTTFFHPYSFVASDHVTKLENSNFNKYIYLFVASLVKRLSEKYSFNREINDIRVKKEKILLPINSLGQPDYEYMEQYMKYLEYEKLSAYIKFKKKKK